MKASQVLMKKIDFFGLGRTLSGVVVEAKQKQSRSKKRPKCSIINNKKDNSSRQVAEPELLFRYFFIVLVSYSFLSLLQ